MNCISELHKRNDDRLRRHKGRCLDSLRESCGQSVRRFYAEQLIMPHNKMSLVDLVQGHSVSLRALAIAALLVSTCYSLACEMQYAQRYQRRLAAKGSSWQASGNPADTLSSGRQISQAATNCCQHIICQQCIQVSAGLGVTSV